jgi:acetyltransferase-like isoleucine patch superfamily enzyme
MSIEAKFDAVRTGSMLPRATPDDGRDGSDTRPSGSRGSTGYFYETDSVIAAPWFASKSGRVTNFVGAYSYMNSGGYLRENVLIGRYVSIGRRVTIAAGGHSLQALSTSPSVRGVSPRPFTDVEAKRLHRPAETQPYTIIDSDVWIGDGAIILPGVHLAVGSVVGANAVVVRDTLPYEIVGGVPAKTIGRRFDEETAAALLATRWWEYDRETLNRYPCANVFEIIEAFSQDRPLQTLFETYLRA